MTQTTRGEGPTVLDAREEGLYLVNAPEGASPGSIELRSVRDREHRGENLGYSARGSRYFHADKRCHRIEGASVVARPISRHWHAVEWMNKPCPDCTIPREGHEDAVPSFESDRYEPCEVDA